MDIIKIELSEIINVDHLYRIDNIYDEQVIINNINKVNNTQLDISHFIFDRIDHDTISFYAKDCSEKYQGRVCIKYKQDKHLKYIFLIGFLVFIFLLLIGVLLPCAVIFSNTTLLYSIIGIFSVDFLGVITTLIVWPTGHKKHSNR